MGINNTAPALESRDFLKMITTDIGTRDKKMREEKTLKKAKELQGLSCRKVLADLLDQFETVDFRGRAGLDEDAKLTRKIYVIISIDEIISKATDNNWGLCIKDGFTYLYNGRYWQTLDIETLKIFLAEAAIKIGIPEFEGKYYKTRDELYKQFMTMANMPTPEITEGVTLINLQNGTFEITDTSQQLREQRREDFLKYQLPFSYDPNATCPLFDKYLKRVLPDKESRKVLAEYVGYIFTNGLKLEKVAILYGGGANGKSVFFDIIQALIGGDNICNYSLQSLTKVDSYERASLSNKLLNYASEINGKLEASTFKQLASGEPIQARQIYGQPFTMMNYAKLMFNCNELPKEVENTEAFFRRFLIFPFTQTIPKAEQDPELSTKIIQTELSGVFNWMLEGLRRLLEQRRFSDSEQIDNQVNEFRREADSVAMFLEEEGYRPDTGSFVLLKTLYQEYKTYCQENGYSVCSSKTVSKRLKGYGYNVTRISPGNAVQCVKLGTV